MIVVNTTFRLAPWADALFAMDRQWWDNYHAEVNAVFQGSKFTTSILPAKYGAKRLPRTEFNGFRNSGASAIELAVRAGASKIILLGYDLSKEGDKAHWHADHPNGMGNAGSISKWPSYFRDLAQTIKGKTTIVNCSRKTALAEFPLGKLEDHL